MPFCLGSALALFLYPRLAAAGIGFMSYALFMGAAMSITAFPVLARILTERNLLRNIERLIRQPISVLKGHPFEAASQQDGPRQSADLGSGIDRTHRPAPRSGFRPHSGGSRFAPRSSGEGHARPAFGRSGRSRF